MGSPQRNSRVSLGLNRIASNATRELGTRRSRRAPAGDTRRRHLTPVATDLRGRTVGDGRYLLLRKLGQSSRPPRTEAMRYAARDAFSGLEVEVELVPDASTKRGFRVGVATLPPRRGLPNLLNPPITTEFVLP